MTQTSGIWRRIGAHGGLLAALAAALALKVALLASGSIGFNSDEAIMMLMARHILQGARPIFTYGQAYMGTLDSYLIAGVFSLFGQTVMAGRVVAPLMYLGVVATTYLLAWRISQDRFAAAAAGLLAALPPVMVSLYTSISLGPWIEILLLNNLLWLIGWDILTGRHAEPRRWLLAGLVAGVGWWELPLIGAALGPLVVQGVWRMRRRLPWRLIALAALGVIVGAVPWLIGLARDPAATLGDLIGVRLGQYVAVGAQGGSLGTRLLALVLFAVPALFGLRPSWSAEWNLLPLGVLVVVLYVLMLWQAARRVRQPDTSDAARVALTGLLAAWGLILALLAGSSFGSEPTGRYLLVLYPPLAVIAGDWLGRLRRRAARRWLAPTLLAVIAAYNLYGTVRAMAENPPGLSTQLLPAETLSNATDGDLIAFLDSIGATRGYSNFWVAYRLAFLTHERIILAPVLPYKLDMNYTPRDVRYPPYLAAARAADHAVYVTSNLPALDDSLQAAFAAKGIAFKEQHIGPYTVFYDLPGNIAPEAVVPYNDQGGAP